MLREINGTGSTVLPPRKKAACAQGRARNPTGINQIRYLRQRRRDPTPKHIGFRSWVISGHPGDVRVMSALPSITDIRRMGWHVRLEPLAPASWSGSRWSGPERPIRWLGNLSVRYFAVVAHCE